MKLPMYEFYEYETVEVHPGPEDGLYIIEAPTFKGETSESVGGILKGIPNILQEAEKGGWETYSVTHLSGVLIFAVRRRVNKILTPPGVFRVK